MPLRKQSLLFRSIKNKFHLAPQPTSITPRAAFIYTRTRFYTNPASEIPTLPPRVHPPRPLISLPTTRHSSTMAPEESKPLSGVEAAKRKAAYRAVAEHFKSDMRFVGIGSGSTIVYGVEAIKEHLAENPPPQGHMNWFVPTGWNSRKVIEAAGLTPIAFDSLPGDALMEVCFDGADEVDEELNCIKGGGACLFQEKLVACRSKKFVCIAGTYNSHLVPSHAHGLHSLTPMALDYRKNQPRLLTNWPSIPIEVAPISHVSVLRDLKLLGSIDPQLREHTLAKAGPIQTDQSFYIIDAPFPKPLLNTLDTCPGDGTDGNWGIVRLAKRIKEINGVLEVGIFCGENGYESQARGAQGGQRPVAVYFGMEDGEVMVKRAEDLPKPRSERVALGKEEIMQK